MGKGLTRAQRMTVGTIMGRWHSSQFDPVYMVGSLLRDGERYPDREKVSDAIYWLGRDRRSQERRLPQVPYRDRKRARKDLEDLTMVIELLGVELDSYPEPIDEDLITIEVTG